MHGLISNGCSVVFMWVPSHVGLARNSVADSAAKDALLLPLSNLTIPHSDYKSLIRLQAIRQWQLRWTCETENKLHSIEPRVNVINIFRLPCRDEIIIHRLRIRHTYHTHGHLLRGETPHWCLACQVDLTVEHVLLHCVSFTNARDNFFCVTLTSMSELFSKVASRSIIDFIKETGFYRKF